MVDTPVSRNRLYVLKWYGGNVAEFCKEVHYHLFGSTSVSFEFHRWVLISEDPHHRLLLSLGVLLVYPGFVSCYNVPNPQRPSCINFSWHVGAPVHPTQLLLFTQVMGHPTGTTFSCAKAVVKNARETSWWNLHDILYFSVCYFGGLLYNGLYPWDAFWGNGRCHSTITVIVFQRSRSRHELSEPPENSVFGRRLISKTVFETLKALLKIFSLVVAIIYHNAKIPSPKVKLLAEDPSPLPDILSHAMKMVVRNQVNFYENGCTESSKKFLSQVLRNWSMM